MALLRQARPALPILLLAFAQCAAPLGAGPAVARTLEVGETREFKLPSEAIRAARDGDRVVIDPGEYFDCAVVSANDDMRRGKKKRRRMRWKKMPKHLPVAHCCHEAKRRHQKIEKHQ